MAQEWNVKNTSLICSASCMRKSWGKIEKIVVKKKIRKISKSQRYKTKQKKRKNQVRVVGKKNKSGICYMQMDQFHLGLASIY